ncbi:MAG: hypothetical protein F6K58_13590 [Symploca sp. SIO2E9]|nr:hypothetical protein [Symploca sp. SIO2E9]
MNAQKTLSNYSINFSNLNTQKRTIEVNLLNYRRRLDRIKQRLTEFQATSELEFLKQFGEDVERRYLLQVQSDYENFSPGLSLLENLINSIRGVTEIDQSERDRKFQEIVAILGVGLAAGALAAPSAQQIPGMSDPKEVVKHPLGCYLSQLGVSDAWLPPAMVATVSLSTTVIFAMLTTVVIKLIWCFRR